MTKKATVFVRLKDGVLDPQGVTIQKALGQMGFGNVASVRSGKFFEIEVENSVGDIKATVDDISKKLLVNPVIEQFSVEIDK